MDNKDTDKVIMTDILNNVKGTCDLMLHGSIESSTPDINRVFRSELNKSLDMQNKIYAKMSEKGWYTTEQAEQQKIDKTKQKFQSVQSQSANG